MTYGPTFNSNAAPTAPFDDIAFKAEINSAIDELLSGSYGSMYSLFSALPQLLECGSSLLMPVHRSGQYRFYANLIPPSAMVSSMLSDALLRRGDFDPNKLVSIPALTDFCHLVQRHISNH